MMHTDDSGSRQGSSGDAPVFHELQYEHLRKVFPRVQGGPSTSYAEFLYNAGQQSVLDAVRRRVQVWHRVRLGPEGE